MAVFIAAMLLIVGLVWLLGAVDQWWILVPVMLVDFVLTAAVLAMVTRLLDDGGS
jgi:hypothetical protein